MRAAKRFRLEAMIRPAGLEVSGLERRRAEGVFVTAHEHRNDHLRFDAQPLFQGVAAVAEQALLVGADGALRERGDLVRERHRALERLAARHHLVDQADALRFADVDAPAGDDELHRFGETDDQRQPYSQPVAGDDVPAPLERAKLCVLRGDADVGEHGGLEPGGEGIAVHRRDDRLEDIDAAGVAADAGKVIKVFAVLIEVAKLGQLRGVLQIPARAESRFASAGDHQNKGAVVIAEALKRLMELSIHAAAYGVVLLGPIVGEDDDVLLLLVLEGLVAHDTHKYLKSKYPKYKSRRETPPVVHRHASAPGSLTKTV